VREPQCDGSSDDRPAKRRAPSLAGGLTPCGVVIHFGVANLTVKSPLQPQHVGMRRHRFALYVDLTIIHEGVKP
jgi:hypothetical protein